MTSEPISLTDHLSEYPSHVKGVKGCPICGFYSSGKTEEDKKCCAMKCDCKHGGGGGAQWGSSCDCGDCEDCGAKASFSKDEEEDVLGEAIKYLDVISKSEDEDILQEGIVFMEKLEEYLNNEPMTHIERRRGVEGAYYEE